ncbi:hypothetical protein [Rivularia sp. UHCC 0363]|uniref:hypothetical protein n=1 Tax=Rivularia sp. UHCC 0363 TaxID=3110244 RepID=UPI002B21CC4E|nr:hypothetical protein [Rivularia sp. UHCC 0363]MEA5594444.1 hypothetical protein [Rivularia sp. UHCC 0363]
MTSETVTLQIPETLYQRLVNTARATQRPIEEIMLRALQVGSPPSWDDIPEEFQTEIAALDKLDDNTLWQIFNSCKTIADMERYNILLEANSNSTITQAQKFELMNLRHQADLFMLKKAQAAVLLRWRGHHLPNP